MKLSKDFYRSMDFATGVTVKKVPMQTKRQSRKLAEITLKGKYPDGTPYFYKHEAHSSVHQCR